MRVILVQSRQLLLLLRRLVPCELPCIHELRLGHSASAGVKRWRPVAIFGRVWITGHVDAREATLRLLTSA